ncbi:uncharacterized protein TRAVEDRAFT_57578 [Trametes versicolor FP-101664 SS1]|uniref:uncharacterized protein n=1 Tax=Trametes versicolor (strain FP-101664) TaxID=717944 RepID=UPI000462275D|nr:uncharacterized protein TRAVEDRAFT_57578 [Trametes versicolor FP-101664 SS1]EIW60274.1 hypothetical protein TRAVEDRAFT_57578 [Trametes versicolor FP-101664 SS1]
MHPLPFVPRPFPPPALAGVPLEYIVDQLRRLAPHYWSRPETSDCTIVVSLDADMSSKTSGPAVDCDAFRQMGISSAMSTESFGLEDGPTPAPTSSRKSVRPRRMIMKLHMDYLCAHSSLFRGLLSGASIFDLAAETPKSGLDTPSLSRQSSASSLRLPCILPSSTCTHPVVHLPIPDPASFHHLIHYVYFGSTSFMEEALENGELSWEGLARNVEYLQMGAEIKLFLGRYWRRAHAYYDCSESESDRDYDSDYDSDSDECMSDEDESTLADPDEDGMCMVDDDDDGISILKAKAKARAREPPRGRQRTTRRLGHSTSDPVISHRAAEAGPSTARRNLSK